MAAQTAIAKFLRRNGRSAMGGIPRGEPGSRQPSFPWPDAEAQLRRNLAELQQEATVQHDGSTTTTATTPNSPPECSSSPKAVAAEVIQSAWRGYTLRKELKRVLFDAKLSGSAVQIALDFILDWHAGWKKLYVVLFLLLFFLFTVFTQTYATAYAIDRAFAEKLDGQALVDSRAQIHDSQGVYAMMHAWIDNFPPDTQASQECITGLRSVCPGISSTVEEYEPEDATPPPTSAPSPYVSFLDYMLSVCENVTASSGFVDVTNRVIGTTYVYQTRRRTKPCQDKLNRIDPYLGVTRECLDDGDEATQFEPKLDAEASAGCAVCSAFDFQHDDRFNFYAHALTGEAFNLPSEFMHCRVNELERRRWLDYRTKQVCFLVTLVDKNGQGRMTAYRECIDFVLGGEIQNVREIASVSLLAGGFVAPLVMTSLSIVITVLHQAWVFGRAAPCSSSSSSVGGGGGGGGAKSKWLTLGFWLRLLAPAFEIAANAMFLWILLEQLAGYAFSTEITQRVFFEGTYSFLVDATNAFALASEWTRYTVIAALALVFRLGDVLRHLDFHPGSAIVGGVLQRAATHLAAFALVFCCILLVYAFIGVLLFSSTVQLFGTYASAVNTLLLLAVGESEVFVEQTLGYAYNAAALSSLQAAYFWFYVFLVSILLFNVLLAIIVGAYVEMTELAKTGGAMLAFPRCMVESLYFFAWGAKVRVCGRGGVMTPVQRLLALRKRVRLEGCTAIELRKELGEIMLLERSVECVITRCRAQTKHERLKHKVLYLRGMDGDSDVLKGHTLALLEGIDRRVARMAAEMHHQHHPAATRAAWAAEDLEDEDLQTAIG